MANYNYDKLIAVLREIFQIDQADLDFGIYRIMNQKRSEINEYLEKRLIPQVKEIIAQSNLGDSGKIKKELDEAIAQAKALGADPDTLPRVQELKIQYQAIPPAETLENEIFSHLAAFFKRYYKEGDFISMRRYKKDVYAIPYEGEEVKLYWANHDQYYIKSSEYLKNYAFKLPNDRLVRFELAEASTEKDNNKEQTGKERRFRIHAENPLEVTGNTLSIFFTYEPTDKKENQENLNDEAAETIKQHLPADWVPELLRKVPTEKDKDRTLLNKHLRDFTARNTFDYFIHKDLGGFLTRELDFYIKNEVLHLDDVNTESPADFQKQLVRIKALRSIGGKIIVFLAQLENFQKRLWLKKKFVVDTQYCITLDRIPEKYYPEIVANDVQREEWVRLFAIDEIKADLVQAPYSVPLSTAFLKSQPFLVLDTKFFSEDFKHRLLAEFDNIDEKLDGLLINSENFQALNLLHERYEGQIRCEYIDPPYNTAASEISYKNEYKKSSWLSLIYDRVKCGKSLLNELGVLCCTIDDFQQKELQQILEDIFPEGGIAGTVVIRNNPSGRPTQTGFALAHEYGVFCRKTDSSIIQRIARSDDQLQRFNVEDEDGIYEIRNLRREGSNSERLKRKKLYYPIYIKGLEYRIPDLKWNESDESWEPIAKPGSDEEILLPIDDNGVERTWRWSHTTVLENPQDVFVKEVRGGSKGVYLKYRPNAEGAVTPTIWIDAKYSATEHGTGTLKKLFRDPTFSYPKSIFAVQDSLSIMGLKNGIGIALDYFAGSGTTAHAVINLNREDGGNRKYILVEMGAYFGTVTKPRVQKVIYSEDWKDGKPVSRKGSSHAFKYLRLESYEDTLNNLALRKSAEQQTLLGLNDTFGEQYLLSYMLDTETAGSLLSVQAFDNPFEYQLRIIRDNEAQPTRIDLVETFNYLIGLKVATTQRIRGFHVVTGENLQGEQILVIWRNRQASTNADLDEFFRKMNFSTRDREFDRIYVNGDNNLQNLKTGDEKWKVALIEEEFLKRMFEVADV